MAKTNDKPWLKQPGECVDSRGVPIHPGDLLKSFHFTDYRRRKRYLYHVAVYDQSCGGMRMVPVVHMDERLRSHPFHRGGNPLLDDKLSANATVISGVDVDGVEWRERPRKVKVVAKENLHG